MNIQCKWRWLHWSHVFDIDVGVILNGSIASITTLPPVPFPSGYIKKPTSYLPKEWPTRDSAQPCFHPLCVTLLTSVCYCTRSTNILCSFHKYCILKLYLLSSRVVCTHWPKIGDIFPQIWNPVLFLTNYQLFTTAE